jgi:hypothetical protein
MTHPHPRADSKHIHREKKSTVHYQAQAQAASARTRKPHRSPDDALTLAVPGAGGLSSRPPLPSLFTAHGAASVRHVNRGAVEERRAVKQLASFLNHVIRFQLFNEH